MKRMRTGMTIMWIVALAMLLSCAAKAPIQKAKVAQDIFISTLETTAKNMPAVEQEFPDKAKEVKKVYMQAKQAVQAYQYVLKAWEKTGEKPPNYEAALTEVLKAIGELRKLGESVGVKYEQ